MRPLAKSLTKQIDQLRQLLRDQSLKDPTSYTEAIKQQLIKFDQTLSDFELRCVFSLLKHCECKLHKCSTSQGYFSNCIISFTFFTWRWFFLITSHLAVIHWQLTGAHNMSRQCVSYYKYLLHKNVTVVKYSFETKSFS